MKFGRIEIESGVCDGKPVVAGTRVTVSAVLEQLAAGDPVAEILKSYPRITEDDVYACIDYAAKSMDHAYNVAIL